MGDINYDMENIGRNIFTDLDIDKDGSITFEEFQRAAHVIIELSHLDLKETFEKIDADKDEKLTKDGNFNFFLN